MYNKILKFLVFIVLLFSTIERVNASELVKNAVKDVYYVRRGGEEKYFSAPFSEYSIDGVTTYCIEPGTRITSQDYIKQEGLINSPFDQELTNKLELIGYYGYDYPSHQTVKYRMATQALIWEAINDDFIVDFWTKQYGYGDSIDVSKEKEEIMNLVNKHYDLPNITANVKINIGETVTLSDDHNVLKDFEVTDAGGAHAEIIDNNLIINDLKAGLTTITLTKKRYTNNVSNLFVGENTTTQIMAYFGLTTPVRYFVMINTISGKLTVEKVDSETRYTPQGDAELKGAVFNLYRENGEFLEEIVIDESLIVKSKLNLGEGKYYIQEVKPGKGYQINYFVYKFDITEQFPDMYISVINNVIKKELQLFKVFGNNMKGEQGISFEIYLKSNKNVKYTITTDENGFANITLPYGIYIVKQLNTTDGYEMAEEFEINIAENSPEIIKKVVYDKPIEYTIKVNKIDANTKKIIKLDGIKFKLKNLDTNEYICENDDCIFETKQGVFTINNLTFGNYQIEEIENQIVNGYIWNKEPLKFNIEKGTANDKVINLYFENTPIKGKIYIKKYGEVANYQNNELIFSNKLLDNIEFILYAYDDIYYNDELIYKKDEIVGAYKTIKGIIEINDLYLGKYYIKETKKDNQYIIDNKSYVINLTNDNQYDQIVEKDLEIINYLKKGKLEFFKKDKDSLNSLSNVVIQIFNEDDKLIFEGETNEDGMIIIDNLGYGKYYLKEKKCKEGYILYNGILEFEIKENDEIITLEMFNEKEPVIEQFIVPKTFSNNKMFYYCSTIFTMIMGIYLIYYGKKDKC